MSKGTEATYNTIHTDYSKDLDGWREIKFFKVLPNVYTIWLVTAIICYLVTEKNLIK